MKHVLGVLVIFAACGGPSADRPLTIPIGMKRALLPAELHRFEYCKGDPTDESTELFPRCDRVGVELGSSWVLAEYEEDRVVRLQRWERFAEENQGVERFNSLVEQRTAASGPPSDDARGLISAQQNLPAGTKTWVAFHAGEHALVGIYLLDPQPPENANVLEEIVELRATEPAHPVGGACADCAPL